MKIFTAFVLLLIFFLPVYVRFIHINTVPWISSKMGKWDKIFAMVKI